MHGLRRPRRTGACRPGRRYNAKRDFRNCDRSIDDLYDDVRAIPLGDDDQCLLLVGEGIAKVFD
jgi:hypothetical protein